MEQEELESAGNQTTEKRAKKKYKSSEKTRNTDSIFTRYNPKIVLKPNTRSLNTFLQWKNCML